MARIFLCSLVLAGLFGCQPSGSVTAVAPAEVPEGWAQHAVGSKMTMVLPIYLQKDMLPKDNIFKLFAPFGEGDYLSRTYIGPDSKGRECMVMMTALHEKQGFTNPEGAINEIVDMMSGAGAEGVNTSKRKVDLPIGPAWRGVVTFNFGGEAMSMITYAGNASGRYYQVSFMESGAADMVLVEDDAIMQTVRFE